MRGHMLRNLKATVQLSEGQRCRRCLLSLSLVIPFCSLHWCTSCIILLLWNSPISKGAPWRRVFHIFCLSRKGGQFLNWIVDCSAACASKPIILTMIRLDRSGSAWLISNFYHSDYCFSASSSKPELSAHYPHHLHCCPCSAHHPCRHEKVCCSID